MNHPLNNLDRYGQRLNTHDVIKIVAVLLMLVDHIGLYFFDNNQWCRLIGRAAAPLFFLLIGSVAKLRLRPTLFIYGALLSLSASLLHQHLWLNILVSFLAIDGILKWLPPQRLAMWQQILFFAVCIMLNFFLYHWLEYGTLGLMLAFSARLNVFKTTPAFFWLVLSLFCYAIWEGSSFQFFQSPLQLISFISLMVVVFFIMWLYRFKTLPQYPQFLLLPSLLISRYSLEIYFFHLISFHAYAFFQR